MVSAFAVYLISSPSLGSVPFQWSPGCKSAYCRHSELILCCGPQLRNLHPNPFLGWSFTVTCKMLTGSQILFKNKIKERQINTHSGYFRESFTAKDNTSLPDAFCCIFPGLFALFLQKQQDGTGTWTLTLLFLLFWMLMLLFHNSWVRSRWTCELSFL